MNKTMKFTLDGQEISTDEALCLEYIDTEIAMRYFMHGASVQTPEGLLEAITK